MKDKQCLCFVQVCSAVKQYGSKAILTVAGWWSDDAALELPETRSHAQNPKESPPLGTRDSENPSTSQLYKHIQDRRYLIHCITSSLGTITTKVQNALVEMRMITPMAVAACQQIGGVFTFPIDIPAQVSRAHVTGEDRVSGSQLYS